MDFKTLFFSWNGRSARKPYWIGIVAVEVLMFVLVMILGLLAIPTTISALIVAYPRICVVTKRLHDLNHSGWWQILPNLVVNGLSYAAVGAELDLATRGIVMLLALVIQYGFVIWLGCIRGQDRVNDFRLRARRAEGRRGLLAAPARRYSPRPSSPTKRSQSAKIGDPASPGEPHANGCRNACNPTVHRCPLPTHC